MQPQESIMHTLNEILIVAGSSSYAISLTELLHVNLAIDGELRCVSTTDALNAALHTGSWSLILCDVTMVTPSVIMQQIDALQPHTPLIFLADNPTVQTAVDLMRLNARGVVEKQDHGRLLDLVRQELDLLRAHKQAAPSELSVEEKIAPTQHDHLKDILETMQDAIMAISLPDRALLYVSTSCEKIFGYPVQHILDDPEFFHHIVHPDDLAQAIVAMQTCMRDGYVELDHRVIWPDGQVRWLHRRAWVHYDENRQPIKVIDTAQDITPRKQAEQAVLTGEAKQKALLAAIPDIMFRIQLDGTILDFHGPREGLVIPLDALLGMNIYDFLRASTLDTSDIRRSIDALNEVRTSNKLVVIEFRMPDLREYEARLIRVAGSDEIIAIIRDITERKQAETALRHSIDHLRSLVDSQTAFHIRVDMAGNISYHNTRYLQQFKWFAPSLIGIPSLDMVWPADHDTVRAAVAQCLAEVGTPRQIEIRKQAPNGGYIWTLWEFIAVQNEAGEVKEIQCIGFDITKQKEAESSSRDSEKRYRDMFELHGLPKLIVDPETAKIVDANPAAAQFYGYSIAQLQTLTIFDISLSPPQEVQEKMAKAATSAMLTCEFRHRGAKEQPHDVEIYTGPIEINGKRLLYSIITDITDKNRAKAALQEAHDLLEHRVIERTAELEKVKNRIEAIFNHSGDGILLLDIAQGIQHANYAFDEMFGTAQADYLGANFTAFFHPDEVSNLATRISQVAAAHHMQHTEARAVRRDGTTFDVEISIAPVNRSEKAVTNLVCIIRDVTERKLIQGVIAEERNLLRTVIDAVPDFIYVKDLQHRMVLNNISHARSLGVANPSEVLGKTDAELFPPQFAAKFLMDEQNLFKSGKPLENAEERSIGRDGGDIWALTTKLPLRNLQGDLIGLVGITHDVTEIKASQEALRYSEQQLRESQNMLQLVLDTIPVRVFWKDRASVYLGCNRLFAQDTGLTSTSEIIGKRDIDLIGILENANDYQMDDISIMESGIPRLDYESSQQMPDGKRISFRTNKLPLRNTENVIIGVLGSYIDITERKHAELALAQKLQDEQEMQSYLKALHEITIQLTLSETLDNFYRGIVEAGLQRFGFERMGLFLYDPVTGSAIGTYGTDKHGNLISESQLRIDPATQTGVLKATFEHPEGILLNEEAALFANLESLGTGHNAVAALRNSEMLGWLSVDNGVHHRPITNAQLDILKLYALTVGSLLARKRVELELRESEARYHRIVEVANEGIMLIGTDACISYVNPKWCELTGFELDEFVGQEYFKFLHPNFQASARQRFEDRKRGLRGKRDVQFARKDGSYFWVSVASSPIHSASEEFQGLLSMFTDIDTRKQAEMALRDSEARYRLLAENVKDVIIKLSPEGTLTYATPSTYQLLGYAPEEIIGQSGFSLVHPEDAANSIAVVQAAVQRKTTYFTLTERLHHKSGRYVWVEVTNTNVYNPRTSELIEMVGVLRDITERKHAEYALRESQNMLQLVLDTMPVRVFWKDVDSRMLGCNQLFALDSGVQSPQELIGKVDADFFEEGAPLWAEYAAKYRADDLRVMTSGIPELNYEEEQIRPNHKHSWLRTSKVPLHNAQGDIIGVLGTYEDITEKKLAEQALRASEEKFRLFIESAPVAALISDPDGKILLVNQEAEKLFGYDRHELLGKPIEILVPEDVQDRHTINRTQYLAEASTLRAHAVEAMACRKDGTTFPTDIQLSRIDRPEEPMVMSFITDITVRKQAEQALKQALAQEKELGDLKSRFVSMASHEFRTPLATILTITETLTAYRSRLEEAQIDIRLDKIRQQVSHMKDIMEDVLQLARIQARRLEFKPSEDDLDALCRDIVEEFDAQAQYHGRVVYECSQPPVYADFDGRLMRQVINNLISNALKYSPTEKPIHVNLTHDDIHAVLIVRDQGIGIPTDDLKHLFEPFHRAANVGSISGTGLGLSITKQAVELHGGSIVPVSQVGVGTTFTITIPKVLPTQMPLHRDN